MLWLDVTERWEDGSVAQSEGQRIPWRALRLGVNRIGIITARRRGEIVRFGAEGRELRAVGAALGVGEDAARKRITRALDRLRELLTARGVTTSTAMLTAALTAYTVEAAPVALGAALTQACLTSIVAAPTHGATVAPHHYYPAETWVDAGLDSPEAVLQTALWAAKSGNVNRFLEAQNATPEDKAAFAQRWAPDSIKNYPGATARGLKVEAFGGTLRSDQIEYLLVLDPAEDQPPQRAHFTLEKTPEGSWRLKGGVALEGGVSDYLLPQ